MSSPAPNTISISPVLPSDIPSITHAAISSFSKDALFASAFPQNITPEQQEEHYQYRLRRITKAAENLNMHWLKAVNEGTDEVVGVCAWMGPKDGEEGKEDGARGEGAGEEGGFGNSGYGDMPSFIRKEIFEDFDLEMKGLKKEAGLEGTGDLWYLATMSVVPTYQGRGVGSQLLKYGLTELVDKDGRECYLEASPAGANMYRRYGFQGRAVAELMDGGYKTIAMLRPAQGQK